MLVREGKLENVPTAASKSRSNISLMVHAELLKTNAPGTVRRTSQAKSNGASPRARAAIARPHTEELSLAKWQEEQNATYPSARRTAHHLQA